MTEPPDGLREYGGSDFADFNRALVKATVATVPATDADGIDQRIAAACAALAAFAPTSEIEGMFASLAVGLHQASMTCLARAMIPGQDFDAACRLRKDAANMSRAFADALDALGPPPGKVSDD